MFYPNNDRLRYPELNKIDAPKVQDKQMNLKITESTTTSESQNYL